MKFGESKMERPFGVALLSILAMIQAILGFVVAALAGIIFAWLETIMVEDYAYGPLEPGFFTALGIVVAVVCALFAIIYLLIAWGLWTGQGWAWTVTLIFTILSLIGSIISLIAIVGIVPLVINILILYYLTRPHVKAFFGKGPAPEAPPPPPP